MNVQADHFDALNLLAVVAVQTQGVDEAAGLLRRAVASKPGDVRANFNYGSVLQALGRFDEALDSFQRAIDIAPGFAEAYHERGNAQSELGRPGDALASYQQAIRVKPDYAEAHNNRGVALLSLRRLDESLESFERALKINPDDVDASYNRGLAFRELGRFDEALKSYERALELRPDHAEAHNNRGVALQALQRFEEARESYEHALRLEPDLAEACYGRGNALSELGRIEEALGSYERALKLAPGQKWLYGAWLLTRMQLCDWRDLDLHLAKLAGAVRQGRTCSAPFPVVTLVDSLSLQREAARIWTSDAGPLTQVLPPIEERGRHERIRIGYYSADFHNHATAYLVAELFESHDRSRFELTAFSFGPDVHDQMRARLSAAFDRFLDVRATSDEEIARLSRELEIDIAVDLKGFTQHERHRLFAYRAAPIQVGYLGYPGTSSAPWIDYLIADRILIPEVCRPFYSEKIVYLPHSYQPNDRLRRIADWEFSRAALGLPNSGFVFCCFNNSYKITPDSFGCWMRILAQLPGSVLWLLHDNPTAANNLRREAHSRGINPARLIFAPRLPLPEHLARHRAADLFLDTLPCNAHTTASDALWAGLPLLTQTGETFAARVAASLLTALGLPELITTTQSHYEALALELATQPRRLAQIRDALNRRRLTSPLFDTPSLTRHLESAYSIMYQQYQAELTPGEIHIAR